MTPEQNRAAAADTFADLRAWARRGFLPGHLARIGRLDGESDCDFGRRLIAAGEKLCAGVAEPEEIP